jgi:hypothetical protein
MIRNDYRTGDNCPFCGDSDVSYEPSFCEEENYNIYPFWVCYGCGESWDDVQSLPAGKKMENQKSLYDELITKINLINSSSPYFVLKHNADNVAISDADLEKDIRILDAICAIVNNVNSK